MGVPKCFSPSASSVVTRIKTDKLVTVDSHSNFVTMDTTEQPTQGTNTMSKPLVFISHLVAEKAIALKLKEIVGEAFMGMIDVFVSSDPNSNAMGGEWLDGITDGLKKCSVELVLASPKSITRPWINFEAGAGWVRDIPVIPICHSGMKPSKLPAPLNSLQGGLATESDQMQDVFNVLADALKCDRRDFDFTKFIKAVKDYEAESKALMVAETHSLSVGVDGMRDFEIATLVAIAECATTPTSQVESYEIKQRVQKARYKEIAAVLGVSALSRRGLVEETQWSDQYEDCDHYGISITPQGWLWLDENSNLLNLVRATPAKADETTIFDENDIPF